MIPTVNDLKSDPLIHKFGDMFNPPGITNFWGCVQADLDITGIRSLNFPPFGISDTVTAGLFIDDIYFPATACPITFTWYPDRILRTADYKDLHLKTITSLAVKRMAVIQEFMIENRSGLDRNLKLRTGYNGTVTKSMYKWANFLPPSESDNAVEINEERNALLFSAQNSPAHFIQGTYPKANQLTPNGPSYTIKLKPGESWRLFYVGAIAEKTAEVFDLFDSLIRKVPVEIEKSRMDWNEELKSIFTPNNNRYSGNLPVLYTTDKDVLRLYHTGILGVISYKRDNPYSVYGRAYDTLMPRYWQTVTFIWDYSLSSLVHALLDPVVMKKYMQQWMLMDIHHHFGTDYLRGEPVGPWYSVNDHAMCGLMFDYLRWTGDLDWLKTIPRDLTEKKKTEMIVFEYLDRFAQSWKFFESEEGLADYGGINNLLECVSTYVHEVASLNAANIFNMRFASEIFALLGDQTKSQSYLDEAKNLLPKIMKLYVEGKGFWFSRHPGNKLVEVRHCYDFITVLRTIVDDLSNRQKNEMVEFFQNELQTDTWIRALSPADVNAMFSVRPDHQWNGAYPAWPAQAVSGLYKICKVDLAFNWLKGLARSANQGPFGQAHFVENAVQPENGGGLKAPPDPPYMCDWSVSGNGSWVNIIIESIFGIQATLNKGISAKPQFGNFDAHAELHNVAYQGKQYKITKKGILS